MIEIHVKKYLNGYNQEKLEEKLREALKKFGVEEFHFLNELTGNEITETKPAKPYEIRISYSAVKDYLKEYGGIKVTKESFEAYKSWLYDDIHQWLKDNAKSFSEDYGD
ncbi:hypothetical protein ACFL4Z_01715 [candidate division KSB1 bacterium]